MKVFKKVTALALAAVLVMGSSLTAFAADTDGSTTSSAGTGQILDFKVQSQVVPTSLQLAINPNGYPVNVRYTKLASDATYDSAKKYYSKSSEGVYSVVTDIVATGESPNWSTKLAAGLYLATENENQIVTFNYGMANKSTVDRKIVVKLDVTAGGVTFVDSVDAATEKRTGGTGTAEVGDYKMFLQLVPAKAGESESITTNTYAKATAYAANTQYYTRSAAGVYSEATIADANAFAGSTDQLYIATNTIGTEIQASELGDVTMNNSTAAVDFATGTGSTSATIGFVLPAAQYTLKDDQFIDFTTTGASLSSKYEMTTLGGVSGFTITGNMNKNTEWSQLKNGETSVTTITVTPTYTITDATGQETAISTGRNQITVGPQITMTADGLITMSGMTAAKNFKNLTIKNGEDVNNVADGQYTQNADGYSAETGGTLIVQLGADFMAYYGGKATTATLILSDDSTVSVTTTLTAPSSGG